jgi:hypothetical protein
MMRKKKSNNQLPFRRSNRGTGLDLMNKVARQAEKLHLQQLLEENLSDKGLHY